MKKHGDNTIRKALRFAVNSIIILFIAAAVVIVILLLFRVHVYIVKTGSMEPEIKTGSICFVDHKADLSDIKCGDVITFRVSEGTAVTHRVVRIQDDRLYTKGDANNVEDEDAVTSENFIGKCVFDIPGLGKIVRFIRSPYGILATLMLIILLITADHILEKDIKDE
ncbi:MAG: signal peptidase I [Eubacterium sp.]|nr:signal peptidase I [Ruminococcus sp.]MBR0516207.1 signal peptidase I [Eubacterium sp.]